MNRIKIACFLFFVGFGIALHDFAHSLWVIGGYREILSLQGGYIGFGLMAIGFILLSYDQIRRLKF